MIIIQKISNHFLIRHADHGAWNETFNSYESAYSFVRSNGYQHSEIA